MESPHIAQRHEAWNKGKLVGQKTPFKLKKCVSTQLRPGGVIHATTSPIGAVAWIASTPGGWL